MDYVRSLTSMVDVCLTLEPGFSTLEDLAFLNSASSVHLLGSTCSPKDIEAIKEFSRSLIWFTYRKNWPAPIGGFDGPTSDRGWGCMIRVGQMVLAQALIKLHLGSNWRWANEMVEQRTDNEQFQAYQRLLRMFQDKRTAQFSIHQIAQFGVSEGKPIGEWLGPNSMAQVLKKIIVYDEWSNLVVHVAMDNVLISDDVRTMVSLPLKTENGEKDKSEQNASARQWIRPLLLIVPLRLGLTAINPCYFNAIAEYFKLPQCVGILGGRPRHAVYFYGAAGKKLLYLDPHICQEFTDIDTPPRSHCHSVFADDEDAQFVAADAPAGPSTLRANHYGNADETPNVSSSLLMECPSPSSTMDASVLNDFIRHRSVLSPSLSASHNHNDHTNNNTNHMDELFLPPSITATSARATTHHHHHNHRLLLSSTSSQSLSSSSASSLLDANKQNQGEAISFPTTSSSVSKISSRSDDAGGLDSPPHCCSSTTSEPPHVHNQQRQQGLLSTSASSSSSSSVEPATLDDDAKSLFIESFADVITLTQYQQTPPNQNKKHSKNEQWADCLPFNDGTINERFRNGGGDDDDGNDNKQHQQNNKPQHHKYDGGNPSTSSFQRKVSPTENVTKCDNDTFDDTSFHCPYILTMDFKSLDPSLALGFLTRNLEEYEDLIQRLKISVLPSSSPPLFEILDSRPKGWPKFTPFESEFFFDNSLDIKEYDDLQYDSDEQFEILE